MKPIPATTVGVLIVSLSQLAATWGAAAISVARGPYLQQGTTHSAVLRWRTDVATDSFVRYGLTPGNFVGVASDAPLIAEHVITITNLQPTTKYYYEIGTSTAWFPGDTNDFFVTSPPVGMRGATRIWVIGDAGHANSTAMATRDAYAAFTGSRHTDVWLMLGDNAYDNGTDADYQAAVFNLYPRLLPNTFLWPALGNHDAHTADASGNPPFFYIFNLPANAEAGGVASGSKLYCSFDYANIHFVCLDSMLSDRRPTAPMCTWLREDLAATTQDWIIVYWHHPPYSKGSHDSDTETAMVEMRQNGASFHLRDGDERLPDNVRILTLPAYSPKLNPVEGLRDQLKEVLCNRVFGALANLEAVRVEQLRASGGTRDACNP